MIARHTVIYFGSRGFAALANMAALAIFTRLASAETYGAFLLILSWAFIVYGFVCPWIRFAFFALYEEASASAQIATTARMLAAALAVAGLVAGALGALGFMSPPLALSMFSVIVGMTIFDASLEIARTRLQAVTVGVAVVLRSVLTLAFGIVTLTSTSTGAALALATALANLCAAFLPLRQLVPHLREPASSGVAWSFVAYGWPLIVSFGIAALGQNVDRLVVAEWVGAHTLGAYGATSDLLKQSFTVFGEVIALSLISVAKRTAQNGDEVATRHVLEHACRALMLVASLGAAFVLAFDEPIFRILLGPDFRESALSLAPYLVVASIFLVFRSFYFGQVIYFAGSSRLDIYAAAVLLAATGGISALLVPIYGILGAALAQAWGQVLACLVFVVAGRRLYRMPVPLADMAAIAAIAALCWGASLLVDRALALDELARIAIKLALFALAFSGIVWRFDIVGIAEAIRVFGQKAAR